jgi:lipopolysaccharide export LptBFGC system permease protein LptF
MIEHPVQSISSVASTASVFHKQVASEELPDGQVPPQIFQQVTGYGLPIALVCAFAMTRLVSAYSAYNRMTRL